MLEPWTPAELAASRFRALAVRHGVDLEPQLPDPAPAYVDPEAALHPALTEPLGSLLLHSWPTPGARASLIGRLLTEPGRLDPADSQDPFVRLSRFADQQRMEPEVRGAFALLLIRAHLASAQRAHRPVLPDPVRALTDPDLDVWRHRRARLDDRPWRPLLAVVERCAEQLGDHEALAFERALVDAGARWLRVYAAWWDAARLLGAHERIPDDPTALQEALAGVRAEIAGALDVPEGPIGGLITEALQQGCAAEAEFTDRVVARPDGAITAKWLLEQQIRSMRNLLTASRDHSLELHRLLRRSDVLRLAAHVGWRVALLDLWLADAAREDTTHLEAALLGIPDPPHATTLAAGLGRIRGIVLLRQLRRGHTDGAEDLARAALRLAPEELAVRITHNDLRYHEGDRGPELLASLREEHGRWDSLSVCLMGARVAGALGDRGRARHFSDDLAERALLRGGADRWLLAVGETLGSARRRDADLLDLLIEASPTPPFPETSLSQLLLDPGDDLAEAVADAEEALLGARLDLQGRDDVASASVPAISRKKRAPAWQRLLAAPPAAQPGAQWEWLQRLRSSADVLRAPPCSAALRRLSQALSRAADLQEASVDPASWLDPARVVLEQHDAERAAQGWTTQAIALEHALVAPRMATLGRELRRLRARARGRGEKDAVRQLSELAAALGTVTGAVNAEAVLDGVDDALRDLAAPDPESETSTDAGLMRVHPEFDGFSLDALQIRPDALRRARELIRLFNAAGGRRDRKRLKGDAEGLYELRHRTAQYGGLRVFYRRDGDGWLALAAMSKYDDRPQRAAIGKVLAAFAV